MGAGQSINRRDESKPSLQDNADARRQVQSTEERLRVSALLGACMPFKAQSPLPLAVLLLKLEVF